LQKNVVITSPLGWATFWIFSKTHLVTPNSPNKSRKNVTRKHTGSKFSAFEKFSIPSTRDHSEWRSKRKMESTKKLAAIKKPFCH
jgi:hypothetical protein